MKVASLRGDSDGVIAGVRAVERHPGDWYHHNTGVVFLGDAADALDRAGEATLANDYLARAVVARRRGAGHVAFAQALMGARGCVRGLPPRDSASPRGFAGAAIALAGAARPS